jgi:hypothetical protein
MKRSRSNILVLPEIVMPDLVLGICVDGRVKPGHDEG